MPNHPLGDGRHMSGTIPRPESPRSETKAPETRASTPHRSGPSPALGTERFAAEEPPSFDKRLTPVVPASWPETESPTATSKAVAPTNEAPIATKGSRDSEPTVHLYESDLEPDYRSAEEAPPSAKTIEAPASETTAVTPSERKISISLAPSRPSDSFFASPPKYSVPPQSFISVPPMAMPSRARLLTTKLLFVLAFLAAVTLLCYEASVAYHVPWLDPRWLIARLRSG